MTFYAAELARIHDDGYGDFPRAAACELLRRVPPSGLVVELGCGSGISSELIAAAGYDVLGIDISPDMLAIARRRVPRARFEAGSIWDAQLPRCIAVTAIGEVINYAVDERAGAERLPELFERIHAALLPGGLFLFDFATPGRGRGQVSERSGTEWRVEATNVEEQGTLERRITFAIGGTRREEVHRLRLYDPQAVRQRLEDRGFAVEQLERYCDFRWGPGYAAFAASVR
ncbi:MAG TPA: class I SAM-dependent methyltransferase [Thermoleophilaceae bacterium]|nr:class I SAM-dependent methyltransferase [Thermoleophilaceae bacterium]